MRNLTQRERVINTVLHKPADFIPHQLDVTQDTDERLEKYFGDKEYLYTVADNHLVRAKNKNHKLINSDSYKDLFGVIWNIDRQNGDIGIVKDYILKAPDISNYIFPKASYELISSKCEELIKNHPGRFRIFEIGLSFFERAWTLRGMEDLLVDMMLEEEFACLLLDRIMEYNLDVINIAAKFDIDCIMLGDDWGQQNGLIMGYPIWKKLIFPRLKIQYEAIKSHKLFVAQHSCGDNRELFKDLIEIGLDIYNTFQPEIYDFNKFKQEYGKYITIYGGISTQGVLSRGTPEQVYDEVKRTIEILGYGGGYITAPTHQCTSGVPAKNITAFIKATKN